MKYLVCGYADNRCQHDKDNCVGVVEPMVSVSLTAPDSNCYTCYGVEFKPAAAIQVAAAMLDAAEKVAAGRNYRKEVQL